MTGLNFCRLEVNVIHSLKNFATPQERFMNVARMSQYFKASTPNQWATEIQLINSVSTDLVVQLQFDNTQLACELRIIDSLEDASDTFEFRVWNFPENTVISKGDYLLFRYYWESDPTKYTVYHGVIKTVKPSLGIDGLLLNVKGQLVNQNILYNWSVYEKYPKLTYYSDVKDFVEHELQFQFISMVSGFSQKIPLPTPILTRGKSVGIILEEICEQINKNVLIDDTCHWKFVNGETILLYRDSDLGGRILNEYFKISVPAIQYNDLLEYFLTDDGGYTVSVFGLPTVVSGIVFYIEVSNVPKYVTAKSAYYTIQEVEHRITLADGYIMKVYCTLTQ